MIVGGFGMGMVFVPLFDIVMAGVQPHEIGSASGMFQAVNGLGMSLGVAGIGAIFFGLLGAGRPDDFVSAAEWTALVTVGRLGCAFVVGFWLPRRARELPGALRDPGSDSLYESAFVETAPVATIPAAT